MDQRVTIEHDEAVVRLTLHGQDDLTRLDMATLEELQEALAEVNESTKLLTLRGSDRVFSVGASNDELYDAVQREDRETIRQFIQLFHQVTAALESVPVPTLAIVEGYAFAGGFELMLASDLRIATKTAKISDRHATYGIVPGGGSTQRLPRQISAPLAKELLFTGRVLSGEEAEEFGLVNRAVEETSVDDEVARFEQRVVEKSRAAGSMTKRLVECGTAMEKSDGLELERSTVVDHFFTEDAKQGFAALSEGDLPTF